MKKLLLCIILLVLIFFGGRFVYKKIKGGETLDVQLNGDTETFIPSDIPTETFTPGNDSSEHVTIYGNTKLGKPTLMNGFVIGVTYDPSKNYDETIEKIQALKPAFWRFSNHTNNVYGFLKEGNFAARGTKYMFVMEDLFNIQFGYDVKISPLCLPNKPTCFKTYDDFKAAWIRIMTEGARQLAAGNYPIQYIEIFGEPINAGFYQVNNGSSITGITPEQLGEIYKITDKIVRDALPNAKVGGPGWVRYDKQIIVGFLDYLVKENIKLNFLSWHEFDSPQHAAANIAEAREILKQKPSLCTPDCPPIAITEYSPDIDVNVPASTVSWFYYLEKSRVLWASRACWDVYWPNDSKPSDNCWQGFEGMLLKDNVTPTDSYWPYYFYAQMDHQRLQTEITDERTVAIVDRDDSKKEVKVLVSRFGYKGTQGSVKISVKNYPFSSSRVTAEIWKVPQVGNKLYHESALEAPIKIEPQELAVINGEVTLNLGSFKDGEVYYLVFK